MKKSKTLLFVLIALSSWLYGQEWVDTLYSIQSFEDISYGQATDVAGNLRDINMDISIPQGDVVPSCGRPLLLVIHGGGFISGDKKEGNIQRIRTDFAKRGYVTASINYRLGQFQTHQAVNCNVSNLGVEWNCLNMADSSEWYRACYRGIQDAHGALRYLVNHSEAYELNPQNIFVVGESAGGFIALGLGYLDAPDEILSGLIEQKPDVLAPNQLYENACIQGYGLDTSIVSMDLSRPDLGTVEGTLNLPLEKAYQIRAVGNFYGAVFNNIFTTSPSDPLPALYLFHQPNDLIVPFGQNKIFAGYASCATQFPFNCQYIINRPTVLGSQAIVDILEDRKANNLPIPDYQFEFTSNNANCALQLLDPTVQGHAFDNYWLRTTNMAVFFASKIETCTPVFTHSGTPIPSFSLHPNPSFSKSTIILSGTFQKGDKLLLSNLSGLPIFHEEIKNSSNEKVLPLAALNLPPGLYFLQIQSNNKKEFLRLILTD